MAPSIRAVLGYFAQIPLLQNLPNLFAPELDAGSQGTIGETLARPTISTSDVTPYVPLSGAPSCPIDGPISCSDKKPAVDQEPSCCFVAPGGRILLTQFWDREVHVGGAEEDWTLHGLWPDLCDGSYKVYCGMTPHFNNITDILHAYNQSSLLDFMNRYWVASYGSNANLWMHEYNKHASCINTLAPPCYGDVYAPGLEVVDYFTRATGLFKTLDTYTALSLKGIVPHARTHYPLEDMRAILEQFSGGRVVLRCGGRRHDELHEAWYVYFVQGSLQSGAFVPAQDYGAHGDANNCAPWVRYLPKQKRM